MIDLFVTTTTTENLIINPEEWTTKLQSAEYYTEPTPIPSSSEYAYEAATTTPSSAADTVFPPEPTDYILDNALLNDNQPYYGQQEGRDENNSSSSSGIWTQTSSTPATIDNNENPSSTKPAISEMLLTSDNGAINIENNNNEKNTTYNTVSALLTQMTKDAYSQLFSDSSKQGQYDDDDDKHLQRTEFVNNISSVSNGDLDSDHSYGLVQSKASKLTTQQKNTVDLLLPDKAKVKSSADLRELAQVFSRALSAYLENPEQFRRILSEVRPTEPPAPTNVRSAATILSSEEEVLAFSEDFNKQPLSSISDDDNNNNRYDNQSSSTSGAFAIPRSSKDIVTSTDIRDRSRPCYHLIGTLSSRLHCS